MGSRYCPECGRALAAGDETIAAPSLVRRWPPDPFVLIAALVAVGGVILAIGGEWAWGLVAILAAVIIFLGRDDLNRRRAAWTLGDLRTRAAATREAMAARSREQIELFRARRELADLDAERERLYRDLGAAVMAADDVGIAAARTALGALAGRIAAKEEEIETLRHEAEARVSRAQAHVRPTEKLEED